MTIKLKIIGVLILLALFTSQLIAQEKTPMLSGKVEISIKNGTFNCEYTLSEMPIVEDYLLLINAGMNIQSIRHKDNDYKFVFEREYDQNISSEAFGYYIPNNTGKYITDKLHFTYTGKFPVSTDSVTYQRQDWKGNIAFNGYSVRTDGMQCAWYPILYDKKQDIRYDRVRCNIEVTCSDCNVIYTNGHSPVRGSKAVFINENPLELMLFAGKYNTYNIENTYFLNPDLSEKQMLKLSKYATSVKKYYESKLGIPYKQSLTFLNTTPVSEGNAWMFVSYPTIANVGHEEYGMKQLFNKAEKYKAKKMIAHELAHYYFGYTKNFNSQFSGIIGEGFAEYLSMMAIKNVLHDSAYIKDINWKVEEMKDFKPVPFASITKEQDYDSRELYVYRFAPLVFTAIGKEIGEKRMWNWCKLIIETKTAKTDYLFLKETLIKTLGDKPSTQKLIRHYFEDKNTIQNALNKIDEN